MQGVTSNVSTGQNYCRAGNINSTKNFPFGQNSSKSQPARLLAHEKNVNFENRRCGFSGYNSMSAELLLVFLPVGITVEREILTVRTIFRFDKILLSPSQTPGTSEILSILKTVDPVH